MCDYSAKAVNLLAMTVRTDAIDCSLVAVRNDFSSYAMQLLNITEGSLERLYPCKVEVCTALWGQSNGDISGVGASILGHASLASSKADQLCR